TAGSTGGNTDVNDIISQITVNAGENSTDNNFGEVLPPPEPASISGFVYCDDNDDGIKDAGEAGLSNVTIQLLNAAGVVINTTTTAADGSYSFTGLDAGTYSVVEPTQPAGKNDGKETAGSTGGNTDVNDIISQITVNAGENSTDNNFGEVTPTPGIDIEKFVNGIDVTDLNVLPEIAAGANVTFTYDVTNTGNVAFSQAEVLVKDDNGTPDNLADDFIPALVTASDVGSDGILSAGETWIYTSATMAAQDLSVTTTSDANFIFSGSSSTTGSNGNIRTFTANGVTVDASAHSRSASGDWNTGYVGIYDGGLGVTNSGESGSNHRVDNGTQVDYLLFEFNKDVTVDKTFLEYVVNDSDISIWIGDRNGTDISTLSDGLLQSFTKENNFTSSSNSRWADINDSGLTGDTLVISAYTEGSNDEFKLKKLNTSVSESVGNGEYLNVATVTANGVSDSDTSGYINSVSTPGIDIEKFVNGIDVTDLNVLPEIAAGANVTFTYDVTNTGNVAFSQAEVLVKDDNGTPDNLADDFIPALVTASDVGSDGILSAGETWIYTSATMAAQDLSVTTTSDANFIFSGSSSTTGSNGNIRTFTANGVTVDASAHSRSASGDWNTGYVGIYDGGLGVTNSGESGSNHRVDNGTQVDYLLFEFNKDVTVDKTFLEYVVNDSDISIWIGDRNGTDISTLSDSLLQSFTKENNFTSSSNSRWADINDSGLTGDTLVISAYTEGSNDEFKLKKLNTSVSESVGNGEYLNVATVTANVSATVIPAGTQAPRPH
ncbi:Cna protein B-type domain-containing protein, partial [Nitrosomonas aestuarii]